MKDVSVRIMTHELWEELCAEGAVRFSDEAPKKATKKKETTKGAVKPPWSK